MKGYDSLNKISERKEQVGYFSEYDIQALLQALASKAGLDLDEIVGAYAKKETKIANSLLAVYKNGLHSVYFCGTNPHCIARVIREETASFTSVDIHRAPAI
jgi:hypothetical protein